MTRRFHNAWVLTIAVVAAMFLGRPVSVYAETVQSVPMPTAYVNDYAGVLNDSTKSDLNGLLRQLDTQAHAQMLVAIIHKMDGASSPAEFANELFAKWKPGPKGQDRGALLVIATDEHKYQFEIGYGLEGILPDAKTGDIGREMVPDLRAGNYDGAVRTAVTDVSNVVAQDAGVTLTAAPQPSRRASRQRSGGGSGIIGLLVFAFILFMMLRGGGRGGPGGFLTGMLLGNMLGGSRFRGGGDGGGGGWGGGGGDGGGGFGGGEGGSSGGGGAGGGW